MHSFDFTLPEIGAAWLTKTFGCLPVQPLAVQSFIGTRRSTLEHDGQRTEYYQEPMRPENVKGHMTFMLKHEGVHLELMARLFQKMSPDILTDWIKAEPTGQYARRAGFLYEWITGEQLPVADGLAGGNYVDAIDPEKMLVASHGAANPRWRVRDNLPGTPDFCPQVRLTAPLQQAIEFSCSQALAEQEAQFGADILRRSAVWMTLRESRSSFLIEGEQDQLSRIQRFASVLETSTGQGALPLDPQSLAELQKSILGEAHTLGRLGIRQSPVFVGQAVRFENIVHYVAPPCEELPSMLLGLVEFVKRTQGKPSLIRAAVTSFAFVFLHPLADGNGRIHRFLLNDVLRRDGTIPAPFILPVSALISDHSVERARYDSSLEAYSKLLMARFAQACTFTHEPQVMPDGVQSNFQFSAYEEALPTWRFPDLTQQAIYASGLLERTILQEMHQQASYFRSHDLARTNLKEILEGPNSHLDGIIRSVSQNGGKLSGKLAKQFPLLLKPGLWDQVVLAVNAAFSPAEDEDEEEDASQAAPTLGETQG